MVVAATQAEREPIEALPRPERLASLGGYAPAEGPLPFSAPHPHFHPNYHSGGDQAGAWAPPHQGQAHQHQHQPQQNVHEDGGPAELPLHMRRQDDMGEDILPLSERAYRALWLMLPGSFIIFSILQMYNVWSQSTTAYNPWASASVVCITVVGGGALMMLYKWVLRGPDGRPTSDKSA